MTRETFSSRTYIAMQYMVSVQVPVKKVSLVLLIVHPKKPFPVGLAYMVSIQVSVEKVSLVLLIVHAKKPFTIGLVSQWNIRFLYKSHW